MFRVPTQMAEFIESQDINAPNNQWRGKIIFPEFDFNPTNVKTFEKNGDDSDKTHLFFVVEEKDANKALEQIETSLRTSPNAFFKTNPLKNHQDKFNVYYYLITEEADYFDRNLATNDRELTRSDPRDRRFFTVMDGVGKTNYHFIFFSKSPDLRQKDIGNFVQISLGYADSSLIYTDYPDVGRTFAHEMGHDLFGLLDEYSTLALFVGKSPVSDLNSINRKNCILKEDISRWENVAGWDGELYEGCSYTPEGIYRGTQNSIMSSSSFEPEDWPEAWGPINEYYISERLEQYN